MALPENCPKDGGATDLPFHFSGRPSAALDHPQEPATLFLPLQSASHYARAMPAAALTRSLGALWARRVSCMRRSRRHGKKACFLSLFRSSLSPLPHPQLLAPNVSSKVSAFCRDLLPSAQPLA